MTIEEYYKQAIMIAFRNNQYEPMCAPQLRKEVENIIKKPIDLLYYNLFLDTALKVCKYDKYNGLLYFENDN